NVFAYSNRAGEERALIVYNNAWASATGRLHTSCASNTGSAAAPCLQRRALREALGLPPHGVLSFRDHRTGLTWLRTCEGLDRDGLRVSLGAYQAHAFVDFRILEDPRGDWRRLEERLGGAGVADPDAALRRLLLEPVRGPWQGLLATGLLPEQMETRALSFLEAATLHLAGTHPRAALREDLRAWLIRPPVGAPGVAPGIVGAARTLVAVRDAARPGGRPSDLDGELLLAEGAGEAGDWALALADGAVAAAGQAPPWRVAVRALLETPRVRRLLGVHEHRGVEWLRREALELLAAGLGALAIPSLEAAADPRAGGPFPTLEELGEAAGYRLQDLLALLDDPAAAEAGTAPGPGPEESP
ncbi:MAG: hypothetical protein FJ098_12870, partial [Deltaproteobacteria bacterium]|nr:hypothetical protein [Deltaproteobacteria bacterium]